MEIAAHSTSREDTRTSVPGTLWPRSSRILVVRPSGELHGSKLAGDPLADGRYERVFIQTVEDGILKRYSALLNLFIRW